VAVKGRLAVFDRERRRYDLTEYPAPNPEPGAVLLEITMATVCGSDIHTYRGEGTTGGAGGLRRAAGHEGTGRVAKLGAGVSADASGAPLRVGDRVVFSPFYPCGRCRACLRGKDWCCPDRRNRMSPGCDVWPHFRGTFADHYYLFPGHTLFRVPDELPDAVVATVNGALCQVVCGLEVAGAALGEQVVIQGAGGLGLYAIAVARERGAAKIVVVDGVPERLELARAFGADELIDMRAWPEPEQRIGRVRELTGGWGADLVVGVVGYPQAVQEGIRMAGQGGRHLEIGSIVAGMTYPADPEQWVHGNVTIIGNNNWGRRHLHDALELVWRTRDKYPYDRIVSHTYPLERINDAFADQNDGRVMRAGLVP
jgi:threonine dehydrogenase-like Zn-dependent dehydrogenase